MLYVLKVVYQTFFLPPGLFIILFLILAGWLWRRRQRRHATALLTLTLLLYLCSIPFVSAPLVRSLESCHTPPAAVSGDVIIVLGGGATLDTPNLSGQGHLGGHAASRLLTAVQLHHRFQLPIIVSGGQVFAHTGTEADITRRILLDLGVPDSIILVENLSRNTTENAQLSKKIMEQRGLRHPILVTSAFHMPRSVLQFAKAGVDVIPYPSDYQVNVIGSITFFDFVPDAGALSHVSLAFKEYIGLAVVRWY